MLSAPSGNRASSASMAMAMMKMATSTSTSVTPGRCLVVLPPPAKLRIRNGPVPLAAIVARE